MNDRVDVHPVAHILCVKGPKAQSNFKIRQLEAVIRPQLPELESIRADFCFFIHSQTPISNKKSSGLLSLIGGISKLAADELDSQSVLVVPRFGTISAWCSKATEIVRRCGFEDILRIERGTIWTVESTVLVDQSHTQLLWPYLHDRMIESIVTEAGQTELIFSRSEPRQLQEIAILSSGLEALENANEQLGLALSKSELNYIHKWFESQCRNPTDAELMMFSQVNSEHCRHKLFNASWKFDSEYYPDSMFSMIRETHRLNPSGTLVAYDDNASVIEGNPSTKFAPSPLDRRYQFAPEPAHIIYKAETHNHPTAISPFPGAATGAGGEIRDEGATGIGGKPKAGLCGFSVSNLRVPHWLQPWEEAEKIPRRISSPLQIMLEAPIGSASFNNEFGRPNIGGYFRTFETSNLNRTSWYGFHKPIMFAGGIGNIRPSHIKKKQLLPGNLLVVIGGPSMLIGLGGGAASSLGQGQSGEELDFASVQRSNPEMQRRCQEVIDRCCDLGEASPILSIHDVGAGGLSNALPEIVHAADLGARIDLGKIPNDDPAMSPMEIWCNEAQERYVLSIAQENLAQFSQICEREHCPFAVVGTVSADSQLQVSESDSDTNSEIKSIDIDMKFLMGGFLQTQREDCRKQQLQEESKLDELEFDDCVRRVLRFPSVSDKSFLITIGDRTVSGLIHRDQMVGPWQVPVGDSAVTLSGFNTFTGEAMAVGERTPIAVTDAPASARMAIGEALTNLRSAPVGLLQNVKLCANWMAAAGVEGEAAALYESVRSVALDLCRELGLSIPVGKDSLSMFTEWNDPDGTKCQVISPISLIVTAFTSVKDVRSSLIPQLQNKPDTELLLIDLGDGRNRMGMSALHQTHNQIYGAVPDLNAPSHLKTFFEAIGDLTHQGQILAYHDRSDGGLFTTLCEMAFAGRMGLDIRILDEVDPIRFFFNEELGAVVQVERRNLDRVRTTFQQKGIEHLVHNIGIPVSTNEIEIHVGDQLVYQKPRSELHGIWSELTFRMQSLRDNPACAQQEYDRIQELDDPGLTQFSPDSCQRFWNVSSELVEVATKPAASQINLGTRPSVAILREQGVNGHIEMAAAFDRAGFDAYDVVMADLLYDETNLDRFNGIVMCGGFSFGDVLGAGKGWAATILYQNKLRDAFESYFSDTFKFALGVCNGCQVMAELKSIIPGTSGWPKFVRNQSEQFEARLVMVEVSDSNSILTTGFQGAFLPIAVAHGEGRAEFSENFESMSLASNSQICLRYVDNKEQVTNRYPYNPNGSESAVAGVTNSDGRITAMMPHPERVFRTVQFSWAPDNWGEDSPWHNLFRNAKFWLE